MEVTVDRGQNELLQEEERDILMDHSHEAATQKNGSFKTEKHIETSLISFPNYFCHLQLNSLNVKSVYVSY